MQRPDLNRLLKTDLNNCPRETEPQQLPARKTDLNNCPQEKEPKHLPARKSIKFGVRKSFISARLRPDLKNSFLAASAGPESKKFFSRRLCCLCV